MGSQLQPHRFHRVFLGSWFIAAVALQVAVAVHDLSGVWTQHFPSPGTAAEWSVIFIFVRGLTPIACLLLGFYVVAVRMWDTRAWLLLSVLVSYSLLADGSDFSHIVVGWQTPLRHLLLIYGNTGMYSLPFWLIAFAIRFPEQAQFDVRHPRLKWIVLLPALVISLVWASTAVAEAERGRLWQALGPVAGSIHNIWTCLYWISIVFFLAIFLAKTITAQNPDSRRRLRILCIGLAVSIVPQVTAEAITIYILGISEDTLPAWFLIAVAVLLILFPITLAYVTVVQRALDVRVIIRQSLQYALARRGIIFLQAFLSIIVVLLVATFSGNAPFAMRVLIASLGISAIPFISLSAHWLAGWVDRRFFREAYHAEQVLTRLADSVSSIVELRPLLETVASRIAETLHIAEIAVFLNQQNWYRPALTLGYASLPPSLFDKQAITVQELQSQRRPLPVYFDDPRSWLSKADEKEAQMLNELRAQLRLPLARKDELLGFLSLGRKASDAPYSATDLQLLQSVASQTALAVENSRLAETITRETTEREVIQRELATAREVQQRFFPQTCPNVPGVEIFGTCRPAREVGGDYYDFFELPGPSLGVATGDVSGKGIPASLLMASLQASLRGQAISGSTDTAQLMTNINRLIYATSPSNRYATFFYGRYELETRCFTYVNAGHNAPIVLRQRSNCTETIRLEAGGPPVGLLPEAHYSSSQVNLMPGDLVVLFTDGISEAMNAADEEWGEDRLLAALQRANGSAPSEIADAIFQAADGFTGDAPQHDDMTLVILRIRDGRHSTNPEAIGQNHPAE